jgi:opacity protein-like surface antigen
MKKVLLVTVLAVIIASAVFADHPDNKLGIGVMAGWYGGWGDGGLAHTAMSLKIPKVPIFWGANFSFGSNHFNLGAFGDKYFIESALVSGIGLHWYVGVGAWANIGYSNNASDLSVGARLPIGLSWHILDFLELFLDIAPNLGVKIVPEIYFPAGGWPIEIGVRFWF